MRLHDLKGIAVFVCLAVALALLGPAAVWAASEGGHESGGLISLDKSLIVQAINFLILLFILKRLLYKPFLAKMNERTQAIQKSLDEAQAARAEATRQQEENETRLRARHPEAAGRGAGGPRRGDAPAGGERDAAARRARRGGGDPHPGPEGSVRGAEAPGRGGARRGGAGGPESERAHVR